MMTFAAWLVAIVLMAVPVAADEASGANQSDEEIVDFEIIEDFSVDSSDEGFSLATIIGRLHAAVVHFPIAWIALLFLVDMAGIVAKYEMARQWGGFMIAGAVLSIVPGIVTGLVHLNEYADPDPLAITHRNLIFLMTGLMIIGLVIRYWKKNRLAGMSKWLYLICIAAANIVVMYAGHRGGQLVRGTDYLPF